MPERKVTIYDIARELQISAATVSRALANKSDIGKATKEKVLQKATEMGYQVNAPAANLRTGRSRSIGVVVPRIARHFFSTVIGGIETVARENGYTTLIAQTEESVEQEMKAVETLLSSQVEAIFISLSKETVNDAHLRAVMNSGVNLFFFDRAPTTDITAPCVIHDNFQGAYQAVSHLIEQAYGRIIHLGGTFHTRLYEERKEGYLQALRDNGIRPQKRWIIQDILTREKALGKMQSLFDSLNPDAVFAASDFAALGVILWAQKRGVRIPDELGVVGFSNEPFTEWIDPSLTTVTQDGALMGKEVARQFFYADSEKVQDYRILPTELTVRNSSSRRTD